jgi:hypothetical protein
LKRFNYLETAKMDRWFFPALLVLMLIVWLAAVWIGKERRREFSSTQMQVLEFNIGAPKALHQ